MSCLELSYKHEHVEQVDCKKITDQHVRWHWEVCIVRKFILLHALRTVH